MERPYRTIGLRTGFAYCVTTIVGAGVLVSPGHAYRVAGAQSFYAWALDLLLVIPLLLVFSRIVVRERSAGGLSDAIQRAFGNGLVLRASQILLLITLLVGTAAIALVGGAYFGAATTRGPLTETLAALALLASPALVNAFGLSVSGTVQQAGSTLLLLLLAGIVVTSIPGWSARVECGSLAPDPSSWPQVWRAMGIVWFAFTGIEMVAFLGGEFVSPATFFTAVSLAIAAAGALYLGLCLAVVTTVSPLDPRLDDSAMVAVVDRILGGGAASAVAYFGFILILVNLNAAIAGASRLLYVVGKEGVLLPAALGRLDAASGPAIAIRSLCVASGILVILFKTVGVPLDGLFLFVGQNWFVLYVLTVAACALVERKAIWRGIAWSALIPCVAFMGTFSWLLAVPAAIVTLTWLHRQLSTLLARTRLRLRR